VVFADCYTGVCVCVNMASSCKWLCIGEPPEIRAHACMTVQSCEVALDLDWSFSSSPVSCAKHSHQLCTGIGCCAKHSRIYKFE